MRVRKMVRLCRELSFHEMVRLRRMLRLRVRVKFRRELSFREMVTGLRLPYCMELTIGVAIDMRPPPDLVVVASRLELNPPASREERITRYVTDRSADCRSN
ncbi:hypothetical protein J6590_104356 [Homalodisca vitripennis]|nr:hypothetical protein J6590_104356 [Homalodisca vitripennis]